MPVCSSCGHTYSKKKKGEYSYSPNQLKKKKCQKCLFKSFCQYLRPTISFNAATKIQAVFRGIILRRKMISFNAAIKIQAVARGIISRKLNDCCSECSDCSSECSDCSSECSDCSSDDWNVELNEFNGEFTLRFVLQRLAFALCMNDRLIQKKKSYSIDWKNIPIELIQLISTKVVEIQLNHPIVLQLAYLDYPVDFTPCSYKDTTVQQYIQYGIHFNLAIKEVSYQDRMKYNIDDDYVEPNNGKELYIDLISVCKRHRNEYIASTDFDKKDLYDPYDLDGCGYSKCHKGYHDCSGKMFYDGWYTSASCECGNSKWFLSDEPDDTFDILDREAQGEHIGYSHIIFFQYFSASAKP